jgi:hypothetical protein
MFALYNFRRSWAMSIVSTAALIVISVVVAYMKVRNYQ